MIAMHEDFRISFEAGMSHSADNKVTSARREQSFSILSRGAFWD
jgi:hypothetical protein